MSTLGNTRIDLTIWAAKFFGAVFGIVLSMVFVAPANTRNARYRTLLAPIAGIIFSPATQALVPFLRAELLEHHMAAATAAGFSCCFLEAGARLLSSKE